MRPKSHPAYVAAVLEIWETRFWSKVRIGDVDACWLWNGMIGTSGYGAFKTAGGFMRSASREAFEMVNGPLAQGLVVCHRCDNRACCNPAHMWAGTPTDNNRDRDAKGRQVAPRGEAHSKALLTEEKVRDIRKQVAAGVPQAEMARKYGVTPTVVNFVVKRRTWRHVE